MSETPPMYNPSTTAVTISTQVMVAAVIFLFMVVTFIFFLYLYAKYYMGSHPSLLRRRANFVFADPNQIAIGGRGLDAHLLNSLPIQTYSLSEFKDGLECAVCLSELSEGEKLRLLPKCGHGFHVECIDMWFQSHTTCPLCRAPVTATEESVSESEEMNSQNLNFPTNVLFWGNEEEGTSSSSNVSKKAGGMLVIDIPMRRVEEFVASPMASSSPLPTSKLAGEEMRTPRSARLRSNLTKLLSRGKMVIGSSSSPDCCSPKGGDIEQGGVVGSSTLGPQTPTSK